MKAFYKEVAYDKTIAINAGSSSLKWQLYEMPDEVVLAKGLIERIGLKDSVSTVKFDDRSESQTLDIADHVQAVKILLDDLIVLILSRAMMKLQVLVTVWLLVENISKNQAWWMKMPWLRLKNCQP